MEHSQTQRVNHNYKKLYTAIDEMKAHGGVFVDLAQKLHACLVGFVEHINRNDQNVRYQFQSDFVTTLHSRDSDLSKQDDAFKSIRNIHRLLYTEVFSNPEHLQLLSFFSKKIATDANQTFLPERGASKQSS